MSASILAEVLAGVRSYDDLNEIEQAIVRSTWEERTRAALAELDLEAEFTAAGVPWVEAGKHGATVHRRPDSR